MYTEFEHKITNKYIIRLFSFFIALMHISSIPFKIDVLYISLISHCYYVYMKKGVIRFLEKIRNIEISY
jgi:hypothetical protein